MSAIQRACQRNGAVYSANATIANSEQIEYGSVSGGTVHVPVGSPITTLTFYSYLNGVDYALYDSAGSAVVLTVQAGRAYPIPAACFGCGILKMAANSTGNVYLTLKG